MAARDGDAVTQEVAAPLEGRERSKGEPGFPPPRRRAPHEPHLGEEVGHHAVVQHGALRPLGRPVAVGGQQAAAVVPARKVEPEEETEVKGQTGGF